MSAFSDIKYIDSVIGSSCSSEALPNALPGGQNSPQVCPYGLYAEQLSGTAFTAPRHKNQRSWLYRIKPSVCHNTPFVALPRQHILDAAATLSIDPNQLRWDPTPLPPSEPQPELQSEPLPELPQPPSKPTSGAQAGDNATGIDFVDGLQLVCGTGDPASKHGLFIYNYTASVSMRNKAFCNADGDFLIVPQLGTLYVTTEFGCFVVEPQEILVIQRGIRYNVALSPNIEDAALPVRGYIVEIFQGHFELPGLGPIGANGLANVRDFKGPVASFVDSSEEWQMVNKFMNKLFVATQDHCPFNVVAWHGNYVPYKYDLRTFNCMNSVTFDHPDPSIYTVLTCPTDEPGVAVCDFVIFPPRWMVMEHTFRPPYYHRNCMSEYMGMIYGSYDAKAGGFEPGGASLHSCMTPHGPDDDTFRKASSAPLNPHKFAGGLAFMFESTYLLKVTQQALDTPTRQRTYVNCWQTLPKLFDGSPQPSLDELQPQHAGSKV